MEREPQRGQNEFGLSFIQSTDFSDLLIKLEFLLRTKGYSYHSVSNGIAEGGKS